MTACIVGGGVVGTCCAYYLAKAGVDVLIVDQGTFGGGCSHANCGYVSPSHVLPLAGPGVVGSTFKTMLKGNSPLKIHAGTVLRDPGWFLKFTMNCNANQQSKAGRAIRELLVSSRRLYEEMIADNGIQCDWQAKGLLFIFQSAAAMEHYAHVNEMLTKDFQTPATRLNENELLAMEPALKPGLAGGWHYEWDAHLRPDVLMRELRRVLEAMNITIREKTEINNLDEFKTDHLILATGAWTPKLFRVPIQPGKGYSITYRPFEGSPRLPMIFEEHRVAVTPFADGFRVGSTMEFAGYDDTLNRKRLGLLTEGVKPYLRVTPSDPVEEWWGWRPMTPDSVPYIGNIGGNRWIAAGHNMLGLSMAPATGKLIAELVTGTKTHLDVSPYGIR